MHYATDASTVGQETPVSVGAARSILGFLSHLTNFQGWARTELLPYAPKRDGSGESRRGSGVTGGCCHGVPWGGGDVSVK